MKPFDYIAPSSLSEACALVETHFADAKLLAGGTDLLVQMKQEILQPSVIIDLKRLSELHGIVQKEDGGLEIGALDTAQEIADSALIRGRLPALAYSAGLIGSPQIRNRATIGGNICRAAPSGDLAPILIALGSELVLTGPNGERELSLEDFFVGPGVTKLKAGELLTRIKVPWPGEGWGAAYERFSYRTTLDLSLVGVAVFIKVRQKDGNCETARITLASVGPKPFRSRNAEKLLKGRALTDERIEEAAEEARIQAKPISDIYGEAWYKRRLVGVLVERAAKKALRISKMDQG